ncbi:hypothetical protein THAOC_25020 [Thalassiosira oceanica]|uniref:Leucine-rich repeat domain-containing protein n=1 Tax=Thalassiosira oceanica TaxID=159749 RepID=K0RND7_THAOC|nr:hypothetical protein THAOC_25020 [Thalassiosira oceanica]|eukprot:EJK55263.1 hypothetical protein THAOC_25020 [Thalassiosira oceanica]
MAEPLTFFLDGGVKIPDELRNEITHVVIGPGVTEIRPALFHGCTALRSVTIPSTVTKIGAHAFSCCNSLAKVELKEGLEAVDEGAFEFCSALRSVNIPSTVTKIGTRAFEHCDSLAKVELNEGLKAVGERAFAFCLALRSVTIPASVVELGEGAFSSCMNLSEVIFLGGERLLKREVLDRGLFIEEEGLLNQGALNELIFDDNGSYAFNQSPLRTVKISTSRALSERMAGLPRECWPSFETAIRAMSGLELTRDGTVLACFPISGSELEGAGNANLENLETTRSLHRVWTALRDLKESSILIDLAMLNHCRVPVPGPARCAILEHCGFACFLRPSLGGA